MHSRFPGGPTKLCCSILNHHTLRCARTSLRDIRGGEREEGRERKSAPSPVILYILFTFHFIRPLYVRTEKRERSLCNEKARMLRGFSQHVEMRAMQRYDDDDNNSDGDAQRRSSLRKPRCIPRKCRLKYPSVI